MVLAPCIPPPPLDSCMPPPTHLVFPLPATLDFQFRLENILGDLFARVTWRGAPSRLVGVFLYNNIYANL